MRTALLALVIGAGCPSGTRPEPTPQECPSGWVSNGATLCVLPPDPGDRLTLQTTPPEGCEKPSEPPPPFAGCTSSYEGDIHFDDEPDMETFCAQYDCVRGGVTIGRTESLGTEDPNTLIESVAPLACLKTSRYLLLGVTASLERFELPNYAQADGGLNVVQNGSLQGIDLPALQAIGGDLSIQVNPLLSSLSLPSLSFVGEFFLVRDNPLLPTSAVRGLRDGLCPDAAGTASTVTGNGPG